MKKFTLVFTISLAIALLSGLKMQAQVSHGGSPYSIMFQVADDFQKISLPQPDMKSIEAQDLIDDASRGPAPRRMGISVLTNLNTKNAGSWTTIPGTGKIWRLQIEVKDALALGVYYSDFFIPEGGELFLYNENQKQILGAYTNENNPSDKLFATEFIQGDKVTLEYFQPESVTEEARIEISELAYAYRDINFSFGGERDAWWCMIDVACSEGDDWENQIDGVARISIKIGYNYYWCSGSLINNTDNDRKNYFLTASHCGGGANGGDLSQWVFYFNYQAATCGGSGSGSNSKTGCVLKAKDPSQADNGSDFYLVEINGSFPSFYGVFYNGWNRTNSNSEAGNGVGVHHPAGDIKKISTYETPLLSSTFWNGIPVGTHWKLIWAETENGKSIMQGGSSGSPIFDEYGRIMGDLTGGYASNSCSNPSPAYYGKLWYSWDRNGTTPATQLKGWLDPGNTGIEKLPGISWEIIPPVADFSANTTEPTQGDTVWFTDESEPGIMEWNWHFEGAVPDTAHVRNPWTVYSDTGYFDVSLMVINADGDDSTMKTDYIHVNQLTPPDAQFEADDTTILPGGTVNFSDTSSNNPTSWHWEFEGGSPGSSTLQNPAIRFNSEGTYDVKLVATNLGGSDSITKVDYITVGGTAPEADFEADNTHISEGDKVNFTDLSSGDPIAWSWEFEGGTPETSDEQNPQNIAYNDGGAFNVTLTIDNGFGENTLEIEDYILVDWVGIEDFASPSDFRVYPNPGTGIFVLEFAKSDNKQIEIEVSDAYGKLVRKKTVVKNKTTFVLNLQTENEGVYFVKIADGTEEIVKKISIVK
jgi:PKD repeat protein